MKELEYKHTAPIQLRFNDIDQFGHVNNSIYFSFYDLGKTEYFSTVIPEMDWRRYGIVIVHVEVDFLAQIFGNEPISVQTAITEIGNKSFKLSQRVIHNDTEEVKCICESTMVAFDLVKRESIPVPDEWIEAICKFEGRDVRTGL